MRIRLIATILLLCICLAVAITHAGSYRENLLKAGFIGKFVQFTRFPQEGVDEVNTPFVITVLGQSQLGKAVRELYENSTIKGRTVKLSFIQTPAQIGETDLLFIAASERERLDKILADLVGRPVLTVSDSTGFAVRGVHFNLYRTTKDTLHFEINRKRLEKDGFRVELRLLELARIVE